jgi:MraZ protein
LFEGQHETGIDVKGRLSVLQRYREQLGENVTAFNRGDHLVLCSPAVFEKLIGYAEKQLSFEHEQGVKSFFNPKLVRDRRYFFGNKFELSFDGQNRLTIPKTLRERLSYVFDVVMVGCGEYLELWSKEKLHADCAQWEQSGGFDMMFGSETVAPSSPPANEDGQADRGVPGRD